MEQNFNQRTRQILFVLIYKIFYRCHNYERCDSDSISGPACLTSHFPVTSTGGHLSVRLLWRSHRMCEACKQNLMPTFYRGKAKCCIVSAQMIWL